MQETPLVHWSEDGEERSARWRSERGAPPPAKIVIADDRMTADDAYGLASQGIGLFWRGDFQNARQLLTAMASRADKPRGPKPGKSKAPKSPPKPLPELFNLERQSRAQRARTLGMLLIPLEADYTICLLYTSPSPRD